MSFSSLIFVGFVALIFLFYPRLHHRHQNIFLLIASYIFYASWDWRFTILLLISTAVDFCIGQRLHKSNDQKQLKLLITVSIMVNLGILCFFKYFNFFIESTAAILFSMGFDPHFPVLRVLLPIGISFYSFKSMTYTFDIYKKKIAPTNNFFEYALFTSFFPQILAGPIERASSLLPQISTPRKLTRSKIIMGLNLILIGYFKKVVIADTLSPIADTFFESPDQMNCGRLWTGVYAYAFQIYGDFSGYTDIARGIALILGFETAQNFNAPYLSRSVTEFWKRWHISLSTWFMDYLYIPLGGNRKGNVRTYLNLVITMSICGLWHGAAWSFVIWGFAHGLFLAGHRVILRGKKVDTSSPLKFNQWAGDFIKIIVTFHIVALAWILFRATSLENAIVYYSGLARFHEFTNFSVEVVFAGCLLIVFDVMQVWFGCQAWLVDRKRNKALRYFVLQILLVSIFVSLVAHSGTNTPFIYFQF